jgi:NADPH-dependent curcumin reductase CurA
MSLPAASRKLRLATYPDGMPTDAAWQLTEEPVEEPAEGQVLVENLYISLDPAMRGWITPVRSYLPPVEIGAVMRAGGIGRVAASGSDKFAVGSYVQGILGVQEHGLFNENELRPVDPDLAPLPVQLGALGMPGLTAYFGLFEVGDAKPGETVVISAAAGAVGSVAGQLAKHHGCRAVGVAGGPEKCALVIDEFGFDDCIDYKNEDLDAAMRRTCPDRIDVYFDNVGGDVLNAALGRLAMHSRIPLCGGISQYNAGPDTKGPSRYLALISGRTRMQGFLVFDYTARYGEALAHMAPLYADGSLKSREHIVEGIEHFNDALLMLFSGKNDGKLVLQVGTER